MTPASDTRSREQGTVLPPIPGCEQCFGCGPDNPQGLRMTFTGGNGRAEGEVLPPEHLGGFAGYVHGAVIAAIMDEVQARTIWASGVQTVTAELNVRYLLPVPLGQRLRASAQLVEAENERKFRTSAELRLADGQLAATATGLFAVPRKGTFGS